MRITKRGFRLGPLFTLITVWEFTGSVPVTNPQKRLKSVDFRCNASENPSCQSCKSCPKIALRLFSLREIFFAAHAFQCPRSGFQWLSMFHPSRSCGLREVVPLRSRQVLSHRHAAGSRIPKNPVHLVNPVSENSPCPGASVETISCTTAGTPSLHRRSAKLLESSDFQPFSL